MDHEGSDPSGQASWSHREWALGKQRPAGGGPVRGGGRGVPLLSVFVSDPVLSPLGFLAAISRTAQLGRDILPPHGPRTMEPTDLGLKPLKL